MCLTLDLEQWVFYAVTPSQTIEPDSKLTRSARWQLTRTRPHLWEWSTEKYRWTYKYLSPWLSPVDKRDSVLREPSVVPKKTKFGRKAHNFNKRTESVSYYLIPDNKPNIWRARCTKTASNSLRVINLGKPSSPNKSLLDKVPSESTN